MEGHRVITTLVHLQVLDIIDCDSATILHFPIHCQPLPLRCWPRLACLAAEEQQQRSLTSCLITLLSEPGSPGLGLWAVVLGAARRIGRRSPFRLEAWDYAARLLLAVRCSLLCEAHPPPALPPLPSSSALHSPPSVLHAQSIVFRIIAVFFLLVVVVFFAPSCSSLR